MQVNRQTLSISEGKWDSGEIDTLENVSHQYGKTGRDTDDETFEREIQPETT